ncbi:adenylate/guanylate cyclase domain-containing protein, partial [Acidobacteriota bacterium]
AALAIERATLTQKINEERTYRNRLERYHAPGVIEMIMESSRQDAEISLNMQVRDVTILFTDLVGFTPLAESLEPQELADRLNCFFSVMVDVIFKYEGTLDKYIGDCLMAIFGAPIPQDDHPVRAVKAAIQMHRELDNLNKEKGYEFQVRTAINSGRVMAGDIGCLKRMEYSVLGDTVNIASRLESSVAQPNQIVIGEDTYDKVKDLFQIIDLGQFSLKGKRLKMRAYEIIGTEDDESPTDSGLA